MAPCIQIRAHVRGECAKQKLGRGLGKYARDGSASSKAKRQFYATKFDINGPISGPLKKAVPTAPVTAVAKKTKKTHKLTDTEVKAMERQVTANQAARGSALYSRIENRSKLGGMRAMRGRINPNR